LDLSQVFQLARQTQPERAFGPKLIEQGLCAREPLLTQLSTFVKQLPPRPTNFLFGKQPWILNSRANGTNQRRQLISL
jgi:hypothetical protein